MRPAGRVGTAPQRAYIAAAALLIIAATLTRLWPLVVCAGGCTVDFDALYPNGTLASHLLAADVRLNSWILAWDTHALMTHPFSLFDANAFYPARGVLTGSEHLLGTALPLTPLAAAGANAVVLHRVALVGAFVLTGLTTFALVRWLTASLGAATAAGLLAVLAPWRIAELSHLQLLSTSWFALIWLLWLRMLLQRTSATRLAALSILLILQLLSSYYLAYYLLASLAIMTVVVVVTGKARRSGLIAVGLAALVSLVVLAVISQPYLSRGVGDTLALRGGRLPDPDLLQAMKNVAPSWTMPWSPLTAATAPYAVPALWLLAGLASLWPTTGTRPMARPASNMPNDSRVGIAAAALWLSAGLAIVMSMGNAGLPGGLAAGWVPGFANLRAPLRWGILVNLALPVLAGIGLARLRAWLDTRASIPGGRTTWLSAAIILLLCLNISWRTLPTKPAWIASVDRVRAYEELHELPAGPVLEVPWPLNPSADAVQSSAYMLAGSRHGHPILNGYTAYVPSSYDYLRRIGARLPAAEALQKLVALSGLRWIVVHEDLLSPALRQPWRMAAMSRTLIGAYENETVKIYEVAAVAEPESLTEALLSDQPRPHTFAGLSRTALKLGPGAGSLQATPPGFANVYGSSYLNMRLPVRVRNDSELDWPGFDTQEEGLVFVRYRFNPSGTAGAQGIGAEVRALEAVTPLDIDIPAGQSVLVPIGLRGDIEPGPYQLTLELVQKLGDNYTLLPVSPLRSEITLLADDQSP